MNNTTSTTNCSFMGREDFICEGCDRLIVGPSRRQHQDTCMMFHLRQQIAAKNSKRPKYKK